MVDFLEQVQTLIRARYPILYLVSHEEDRTLRLLRQVAQAEHMELSVWRRSDGLNGKGGTAVEALQHLVSQAEPTMLLFLDAHQDWKDVNWVRTIRDETQSLVQNGHTVVLLSPIYSVPLELEKLVSPLDVPLPSGEEVSRLFSFFCLLVIVSLFSTMRTSSPSTRQSLTPSSFCFGLSLFPAPPTDLPFTILLPLEVLTSRK